MGNDKVEFINSFFRLFDAEISVINCENDSISGEVVYKDESGSQSYKWYCKDLDLVPESIALIDFIVNEQLIDIDMLIISREQIIENLILSGWERQKAEGAIDFLMQIEIKMIDDGEETDSWFIHF